MATPRGIRNNNPGNIRVNPRNNWRGKITGAAKRDRSFEEFETLEYGYRALLITLRNYIRRHGLCTLRAIITRWAPPSENDTEAYIARASQLSGIAPGECLQENDESRLCRLAYAISHVENGQYAGRLVQVHDAWDMM